MSCLVLYYRTALSLDLEPTSRSPKPRDAPEVDFVPLATCGKKSWPNQLLPDLPRRVEPMTLRDPESDNFKKYLCDPWNGSRSPGFLKFMRDLKSTAGALYAHAEDDYSIGQDA